MKRKSDRSKGRRTVSHLDSTTTTTRTEPVLCVVTKDGKLERRHKGKPVDVTPVGARHAGANPAFAAPYVEPRAMIVDADYSDLERRFEALVDATRTAEHTVRWPHRDSPAGALAGRFWLVPSIHDEDQYSRATASGNARQRRRQVRAWKRQGFTVTQTDARTGAIIRR